MENIEQMLNEEIAEKKKTGRSYFNSANVHPKRKDHLPYEMMKGKERKEYMQGSEVKTYNVAPQPNGVTFNLEGFTRIPKKNPDIVEGFASLSKSGIRIASGIGDSFGQKRFDLYFKEQTVAFVPCHNGAGEVRASAKGGYRVLGDGLRDLLLHCLDLELGSKCKAEYNKGVILLRKE